MSDIILEYTKIKAHVKGFTFITKRRSDVMTRMISGFLAAFRTKKMSPGAADPEVDAAAGRAGGHEEGSGPAGQEGWKG